MRSDWKSGDRLRVLRQQANQNVEAIAPFGRAGGAQGKNAEEMVKDLKAKVFAGRELRYLAVGEGGAKLVRVV